MIDPGDPEGLPLHGQNAAGTQVQPRRETVTDEDLPVGGPCAAGDHHQAPREEAGGVGAEYDCGRVGLDGFDDQQQGRGARNVRARGELRHRRCGQDRGGRIGDIRLEDAEV